MKATAIAPSNIAFIKYWGKSDQDLRVPTNDSISMNLSGLLTTTTVEVSSSYTEDEVWIDGKKKKEEGDRVSAFLDIVRKTSGKSERAKVYSQNSFPSSTGLSSSASGFAALALASSKAYGLVLSEQALSILARKGSGSACRSIPSGFVRWFAGSGDLSSYASSMYPPSYWDMSDVVAIVSDQKKEVSTTKGQRSIFTNPFFPTRCSLLSDRISDLVLAMKERDFHTFGTIVEKEAFELHAMMMTSDPPLLYLLPESVSVIRAVRSWRQRGLPVYITLNTGQDVHCICEKKDAQEVEKRLLTLDVVKKTIVNVSCEGANSITEHLF